MGLEGVLCIREWPQDGPGLSHGHLSPSQLALHEIFQYGYMGTHVHVPGTPCELPAEK